MRFILLVLLITGCAHTGVSPSELKNMEKQDISKLFQVNTQEFSKFDSIEGDYIHDNPGLLTGNKYKLIAEIDKKSRKVNRVTLVLSTGYQDSWKFYNSCVKPNGTTIKCTNSLREVISCTLGVCIHQEAMSVPLSQKKLKLMTKSNTSIGIKSKRGQVTKFNISSKYITAFLEKI